MTLVAAVVQGDAAYLYSDTGHFDAETGVLLGIGDKIMQGQRFPWACGVTFSGPLQARRGFGMLEARDADGLFDRLPRAIRDFRKRSRKLGCANPAMRLVAIAWDEKQARPRIFVCGDGLEAFGVGPDDAREAEGYFFGAATNDIAAHWGHADGGSPTDPAHFDHIVGARAVFEGARNQPFVRVGGSKSGHFIGGQLHCMELTEYGSQLYCIHDWGDRLGRRIRRAW